MRSWPGNAAFIAWAVLTITLMLRFDYTYGWNGNGSADFGNGAALALWLQHQSARGIAFAMFNEFGALYVLAPAGFLFAPRRLRRLVLVSLPIAAIFGYVQQPDRGLWNFHYLVAPLAVLVLERAPAALAWATIVSFAIGNLRVGAQLPIAGVARWAIALSLVLAVVCTLTAWRNPVRRTRRLRRRERASSHDARGPGGGARRRGRCCWRPSAWWRSTSARTSASNRSAASTCGAIAAPVLHQKQPNEVRIAVVGGDLAFGWGVAADETLAAYLRRLVILDLDRARRSESHR